jgi:hypothetical protein
MRCVLLRFAMCIHDKATTNGPVAWAGMAFGTVIRVSMQKPRNAIKRGRIIQFFLVASETGKPRIDIRVPMLKDHTRVGL